MKIILPSMLMVFVLCSNVVYEQDRCNSCTELKSEKDCGLFGDCAWEYSTKEEKFCVKSLGPPSTGKKTFCSKIAQSVCAQTLGCAFKNNECILFSGCSAYSLTTLDECQKISNKCVTNEISCINISQCSQYSEKICEKNLNSSGRKCKWDSSNGTCRDFNCSEANNSLTTDQQCDAFSSGCFTTGQGCITPPLLLCSTYTGTSDTCQLMKGKDGYCEYDGILNCKAKQCKDAPASTNTDQACNTYQIGCITTGKGCTDALGYCNSYVITNPQVDCQGYIGQDGICEGDIGQITCRSRICDNSIGNTDTICNDYKKGCISNGIKCTNQKQQCSIYKGTILTCPQYIAIDGQCKGISDIEGYCKLKDCIEDSQPTYITDQLCQSNIQQWCVSTGRGCVKTLQSCTTYTADDQECQNLIGSEGKCTVGISGNCAPRLCENAPNTYTTNQECSDYFTNCITNGAGCIKQTTCLNTISQLTCLGTKENQISCNWNPLCISNTSCNSFTLQSICINNFALNIDGSKQACKWDQNTCINAQCNDFKGSNNDDCDKMFPGCVFNGIECVDPNQCSISFKGNKNTCLQFKAYCTNIDQALSTDSCIQRQCNDNGLTYKSDDECIKYYPQCLTNGNGCISNTLPCSSYSGTQSQCNQFYGYYNGKVKGARCWNINNSGQCIEKQCIHAQGMKNNNDCDQFFKGCLYNGDNSCVDINAQCSSYKYTTDPSKCQNYKGLNGTILCYQGISNQCKNRVCSDNNTATKNSECNLFLQGCKTKGIGCISPDVSCTSYEGTKQQCNQFSGNYVQCSNYITYSCSSKICSNKTDATNNSDCVNYHSKCRLKQGEQVCQDVQSQCTGYTLTGSASVNDKQTYCNQVTTQSMSNCSYDSGSTCVDRTCQLWNSLSSIDCINYKGPNTCSYADSLCKDIQTQTCETISSPTSAQYCNNIMQTGECQYYNSKCYTTKLDCVQYSLTDIPTGSESDYCSSLISYQNGVAYQCKFVSGSNCSFSIIAAVSFNANQVFTTCENIREPTNQANCDTLAGSGSCKYLQRNCYTIATGCTTTVIPTKFTTLDQRKVFCMNMQNPATSQYCTFTIGQPNCSLPIVKCENMSTPATATDRYEFCLQRNQLGLLCIYDASYDTKHCATTYANEGCELITNGLNQYDCYIRTNVNLCVQSPSGKCVQKLATCANFSVSGTTADSKALYCQHYQDTSNNYCSWISAAKCETSKNTCTDWDGLTITADNLSFCLKRIDKNGTQCSYIPGEANCSNFVPPQNSQADCDFYYVGSYFNSGTCNQSPALKTNCNQYTATGDNDDKKFAYCNFLVNTDYTSCTFIKGTTNCVNKDACSTYDVSSLSNLTDKQTACKAIKTTDTNGCIYTGTGGTCSSKSFSNCEEITGVTNQTFCDAFLSNCFYYSSKCYTLSATCNYTTGGSGAIAFCNAMKNSNGDYCTASTNTSANCIDRTCSDTATSSMTQNNDCKSYKQSCKSDGTKCIDSTIACSTNTLSDCITFLDTDNLTSCTSTSSNFSNNCVNANSLCSSFTGTQTNCQNQAGTDGQCWGGQISGPCRQRQCSDKQTPTSDSDCHDFLIGCLYNGVACIDKSQQCSSYQGTSITCKNYKGQNGTIQCWSNSQTIDQCKNKECTDLAGTDDKTCSDFIPIITGNIPNCVTDGVKCVSYPRSCSDFQGNVSTCQKFTALDGPCKADSSNCTPRICIEAPISFNTDEQCKNYHPNCMTNGSGCINKDIGCKGIQTQISCSSNQQCTWAYSCKQSQTCNLITKSSQCSNTIYNGIQCFWSNGQCRNITCNDYDRNLNTHQQCQDINKQCTTSGQGCVLLGQCNNYQQASICNAANTIEQSIRCTWNNNQCRQRICSDYQGTTDQDCNNFLNGCKSSGSICIGSIYNCQVFNGNKNLCIQDSNGNQCYYLNDICYNYTNCQDIPYNDFDTCQSVSKDCVPSISNCISIRPCDQYEQQESCIIGLNDTKCGWISSTYKCQIFNSCSDYQSTSQQECQLYGSKCITDGQKCIEQNTCAQYMTETACQNPGTDGLCNWNTTNNSCRLRECGHLNGTTDFICQAFIVNKGICTTNGTKCIPRANCQEYLTQESCTIDLLGNPCLFTYSLGNTTGTQSCRSTECSDIQGISNDQCSILNQKQCVSDGKSCVKQSTCGSYKNQISCNGGGSDGQCVFNPLTNTCYLFVECQQALYDEIACKKKSKTCLWGIDGKTKSTSCLPLTCAQKANGTECFPIPSFDGSKYTICSLQNNVCTVSEASNLTSDFCYVKSQYTYTWNQSSQKCVQCKNSINNTTTNDSTNNITQDQFGWIISIYLIVLGSYI